MKLFPFVITATLIALLLVYFLRSRLDEEKYGQRKKMRNDKLVIVTNADFGYLKLVLQKFCRIHNKTSLQAVLSVTAIGDRESAISFPVDIDFEIFCYLINFLQNSSEAIAATDVTAWATPKPGDPWITALSANKKAMLFLPLMETGADCLFLTTEENIGYKLQLSPGGNELLLDTAVQAYSQPPLSTDALAVGRWPMADI